jgi:hypothetical protein
MFRHLHDRYGKPALVDYWRHLGSEYYARRIRRWKAGGLRSVAADWEAYFKAEPGAQVTVTTNPDAVQLDISVCPAIKHLRESGRDIVPYFCEHCDHVCGAMAEQSGMHFEREGGNGSCVQRFIKLTVQGEVT